MCTIIITWFIYTCVCFLFSWILFHSLFRCTQGGGEDKSCQTAWLAESHSQRSTVLTSSDIGGMVAAAAPSDEEEDVEEEEGREEEVSVYRPCLDFLKLKLIDSLWKIHVQYM